MLDVRGLDNGPRLTRTATPLSLSLSLSLSLLLLELLFIRSFIFLVLRRGVRVRPMGFFPAPQTDTRLNYLNYRLGNGRPA